MNDRISRVAAAFALAPSRRDTGRELKAGDVFNVPQGKIHQAINYGTDAVKLVAVFIAKKASRLLRR